MQRHTRTHLRLSGNVEKSDENRVMQSIEITENPLNFEHSEWGLNMLGSAKFTHI